MRRPSGFFCMLSILFLMTACTKQTYPIITTSPQLEMTATAIVEVPTSTITPEATAMPPGVELPLPLYFLSDGEIWLLSPGEHSPRQLAIEGEASSMDVWPGDNRIAYGTTNGKVYTLMPGQEPVLLHNVQTETDAPVRIRDVSWSFGGTKLAYTVAYTSEQMIFEAGYPSYPSGLWVFDMQGQTTQWLLSDHYMRKDRKNVGYLRVIVESRWSPDDTALLLRLGYWEWTNCAIFEPLDQQLDETNLYPFDVSDWGSGFWTRDGQATVIISGQNYGVVSDLMYVDRVTKESKLLIDGEAESLYVDDAQELPDGIVFLGTRQMVQPGEEQLYLGKLTERGFQYAPTGPTSLCNTRETGHIEWDPSGHWGVFVCQYGPSEASPEEVHVISLDGENIDLTPDLNTLPNTPTTILWGSD